MLIFKHALTRGKEVLRQLDRNDSGMGLEPEDPGGHRTNLQITWDVAGSGERKNTGNRRCIIYKLFNPWRQSETWAAAPPVRVLRQASAGDRDHHPHPATAGSPLNRVPTHPTHISSLLDSPGSHKTANAKPVTQERSQRRPGRPRISPWRDGRVRRRLGATERPQVHAIRRCIGRRPNLGAQAPISSSLSLDVRVLRTKRRAQTGVKENQSSGSGFSAHSGSTPPGHAARADPPLPRPPYSAPWGGPHCGLRPSAKNKGIHRYALTTRRSFFKN